MSPPSARSGSGSAPSAGSRLILASASPRRREILERLGVPFEAVVTDVQELTEGEPAAVVVENARRKARAGAKLAGAGERTKVLGVDTDVALDGRLLGKAADDAGARARLEALSGRTHEVLSGIVVLDGAEEHSGIARTEVTFGEVPPATISLYVDSGEWRDRAGAYAIQGLGSILIESIRGDFSNVVGLPVPALLELMPDLFSLQPRQVEEKP
jgi:septum formation protein